MVFSEQFTISSSICRHSIAILILFFAPSFAAIFPQESETAPQKQAGSSRILSLNDCLAIAMENNHKIRAAHHALTISEYKKKQAESAYWPQVSVKAAYSYTDQDPLFAIPSFKMSLPQFNLPGMTVSLPDFEVPQQDIKLMDRQNIHAMLEMTFPIYTGGKITAVNEQARQGIEISRQEQRKTSLEIQYEVTRYYYSALLSKKIYDIAAAALEKLEITLKLTESIYLNGSGKTTRLDYLKNKVMVDQVRSITAEMKKNVSLSKDALSFVMSSDGEFSLPEEDIPFTKYQARPASSESDIYSGNADWGKVNAALLYYQAKVDEAYSGYLPKLGIAGSFAQNINSYKSGITNNTNSQLWMISLGVEIPLFEGFRTSNEVNEARVQLNKTEEEKLLLQDAISLQIKDALKRIDISEENVSNTLQAKLTSAENRSLNERAFQVEMAEAKDLIEAQIMEALMEVQHLKALYDHVEAGAYLNYLTGKALNRSTSMVEK